MTGPVRFDASAEAERIQAEVSDQFEAAITALEESHSGDPYKAVITANLMVSNGIAMLIHYGISPEDMMTIVEGMIRASLDDSDVLPFAIPSNIADGIKKPEGKPS